MFFLTFVGLTTEREVNPTQSRPSPRKVACRRTRTQIRMLSSWMTEVSPQVSHCRWFVSQLRYANAFFLHAWHFKLKSNISTDAAFNEKVPPQIRFEVIGRFRTPSTCWFQRYTWNVPKLPINRCTRTQPIAVCGCASRPCLMYVANASYHVKNHATTSALLWKTRGHLSQTVSAPPLLAKM